MTGTAPTTMRLGFNELPQLPLEHGQGVSREQAVKVQLTIKLMKLRARLVVYGMFCHPWGTFKQEPKHHPLIATSATSQCARQ